MPSLRPVLLALLALVGLAAPAGAQVRTFVFSHAFTQDYAAYYGLAPSVFGPVPTPYTMALTFDPVPTLTSPDHADFPLIAATFSIGELTTTLGNVSGYATVAATAGGSTSFSAYASGDGKLVPASNGPEFLQFAFVATAVGTQPLTLPASGTGYNPATSRSQFVAYPASGAGFLALLVNSEDLPGYSGAGGFTVQADAPAAPLLPDLPAIGGGALPEPASWALLILGLGAVGAALRCPRLTPQRSA